MGVVNSLPPQMDVLWMRSDRRSLGLGDLGRLDRRSFYSR
jgi:hypothetical protein